MSPLYRHTDGTVTNVSGTDEIARFEASPVHEAFVEPPFPEGAPAKAWKVDELKAWAAAHTVDLTGASTKDEILAAVTPPPAPPADPNAPPAS